MSENPRRLYQGAYRTELEDDVVTQSDEPTNQDAGAGNTSDDDPADNPEERSWKKRYGDLRRHSNSLTERISKLETQLHDAQRKEIRIPSSKEELEAFSARYPDVYRHIRSIVLQEHLQTREDLANETKRVEEDLDKLKRERGYQKILQAHPDFKEINESEKFHDWAGVQPLQIQNWLFENDDPELCVKALDLYKAEMGFKEKKQARPRQTRGADNLVETRRTLEMPDQENKRMWKASDIQKLHPKQFEKLEAEIELARAEGRIDIYA